MACSLNDPREHVKFIALTAVELRELAATQDAINAEDYARGIYQEYIDDGFNPHDAAEYAQFVPNAIHRSLGLGEIAFKVDMRQLKDLIDNFKDLNYVKKLMNDSAVTEDEVKELQKEVQYDAQTPTQAAKQTPEEIAIEAKIFRDAMFAFKVASPFATTGQQGKKNKDGSWTDTKDIEQDFYYDFFRTLEKKLTTNDAKKVTIGNHTGFAAKYITKQSFDESHLMEDEKRLLAGDVGEARMKKFKIKPEHFDVNGTLKDEFKTASDVYINNPDVTTLDDAKKALGRFLIFRVSKAAVITDTDGKVLFFDQNYNTTTADQGKPLYYNIRTVQETNGVYSAANIQSPKEIAANTGISVEEAYKVQQKQLKALHALNRNRDINLNITGVNRGVLNIRMEEGDTKISDINWDASDIDLNVEMASVDAPEIGEKAGGFYVAVPGHRSIPIQADNISADEINRILDMVFTDNLLDEYGGPVSADKKIKLARHILLKEETGGVGFYPQDDNSVKVTLNGVEVTKENKDQIVKYLRTPYKTKAGNISDKYMNTRGQYAFHKSESGQEFEEFEIDEDGKLNITPTDINKHVSEHGSLAIIPNTSESGDKVISFLNGYMTFDIAQKDKAKLGLDQMTARVKAKPQVKKTEPIKGATITEVDGTFDVLDFTLDDPIVAQYVATKEEAQRIADEHNKSKKKDLSDGVTITAVKETHLTSEDIKTNENKRGWKPMFVRYTDVKNREVRQVWAKPLKVEGYEDLSFAYYQPNEGSKFWTIVETTTGQSIISVESPQKDIASYTKEKLDNIRKDVREVIAETPKIGKTIVPQVLYKGKKLPSYIINRDYSNKDGSKRLAGTDGKNIILNPVTDVKEFFDYIQGKNKGGTSQQKEQVLEELLWAGYNLTRLRKILDTPKKVNTFLVLHEQSHIDNNDKDIYWKNGKDLLTPDKIAIELRASIDALEAIEGVRAKDTSPMEVPTPKETPEQTVATVKKTRKRRGKTDTSGLKSIRLNEMKATPEEIAKAKRWYDNSPLAKHVPYTKMFDVVNSNAWAEFVDNSIKLYSGSNYTVLYHEAWHAFSQHVLSPEQQKALYSEVSKTSEGKKAIKNWAEKKEVSVEDLSDYQKYLSIEELLAEDFRQYALSDGKKVLKKSPARTSVFQNILNFFKKLFGKITGKEVLTDKTMLNVEELYAQLFIGNINNYTSSQTNSFFGNTALYSKPDAVEGQTLDINEQDSQLILDSINGIMSTIIDERNAELQQVSPGNTKFTTAMYSDPDTYLAGVYGEVFDVMADRVDELEEQASKLEGPEKQQVEDKINLLNDVLDNFTPYEDNNGIVAWHLQKSDYLKEHVKDIDKDTFRKTRSDVEAARWDLPHNGLSKLKMASDRITFLLNNIKKYTADGKQELNDLGFPVVMQPGETINKISTILGDFTDSPREIYDTLKAAEKDNPWVSSLLRKLGLTSSEYREVQGLWTGLWDVVYTSNQPLHSVMINRTTDEDGNVEYEVLTGYASTVFRKVEQEFKSNFKVANNPNEFIVDTGVVGNVLDTKKVLAKWKGNLNTPEAKLEFLRDIGLPLTEKPKILKGLEGRKIGVKFIYDKLEVLDAANIQITDVIKALRDSDIKLPSGKIENVKSQSSDLNKILALEAKHSGNYNNFSVTTVKGNLAHEYGRMSTKAVMVKNINKAKNFNDLINMPEMAHLNPAKNPRAAGLTILKSMFMFDKGLGTFTDKRPGARLRYDIADGIQNITESLHSDKEFSQATSNSDSYARFMQDFYSMFLEGKPSSITPADKGTITIVSAEALITDGKDKNLYVDTADFNKLVAGVNKGVDSAYKVLLPSIEGELGEMHLIANDPDITPIPGFTIPSLDKKGNKIPPKGLEFSAFSGTFQASTKEAMKAEYAKSGNLRNNPELRARMLADLGHYFRVKTAENYSTIDKMLVIDANLRNIVNKQLDTDASPEAVRDLLMQSYTVNKFIHNLEQTILFYGSTAQFKDLDKRNPSIDSAGRMPRTDQDAISYINNEVGRPYQEKRFDRADKKGFYYNSFSEVVNAGIFKEDVQDSALYDHYEAELMKDLADRIPNEAERKLYIKNKLDPYNNMETADAQGYITFDSYRILGQLTNRWSDQQEALYQQIVNNPETVKMGEVAEYFPSRKYQYAGALATAKLHATAFHKFALLPLIPTMIKGTELETLHDDMMKNGIDYSTFQTGSKVSTIVAPGEFQADNIFEEDGSVNPDATITKNPVYLRYLKDQLDINSEYKGKVIFSTQLRKLIEEGLVEGGVPVDFMAEKDLDSRIEEWSKLTDSEKLEAGTAQLYSKYKKYESEIQDIISYRMAELIKEVGSTPKQLEEGTGDINKLVDFLKKELARQELTDHELDFIGVNDAGTLINDLSTSPSAAQIEKLLNAIVNNRLIRQKINGESLVQVSNTMFHPKKATAADYEKWGTKDLQSYRRDSETGETLGMQVKVALQGKFKSLTRIKHPDGKNVAVYTQTAKIDAKGNPKIIKQLDEAGTLARLNETINSEEFQSSQENLDMITMVGVRIPVQGHNSMEFMTVKEFLPESAGNIIVPPAEIVAKSGSDFDVDKLTIMMPNISTVDGKPKLFKELTTKLSYTERVDRLDEIKQEIKKLREKKVKISGISKTLNKALSEYTDPLNSLEDRFNSLNALVASIDAIKKPTLVNLELRDKLAAEAVIVYKAHNSMFEDMEQYMVDNNITDDSVDEVKDAIKSIVKEISTLEEEADSIDGAVSENAVIFSIRDILQLAHNFESLVTPNDTNIVKGDVWSTLVGKRKYTDKVGVWGEPGFQATRYFEAAYNIHKHEANAVGKETLGLGAVSNTWNTIFNRVGAYINPKYDVSPDNKNVMKRAEILMKHHKRKITSGEYKGKDGISLSHTYDVDGKNKISEVISQLMNGWVDVAKDPWIFDIQGNKQVTPTIDFLLEAGVPFESVIYFVSNPLVKEYVKEQKIGLSPFSKPLGMNAPEAIQYRREAQKNMFRRLNMPDLIGDEGKIDNKALEAKTIKDTKGMDFTSEINGETLAKKIGTMDFNEGLYSPYARAAFLHYLELENLAKQVSNVKLKLNYDTSKSNTLFDAAKTEADLKEVEKGNLFPASVIKGILEESPIGSFRIAPFQMKLWGPLFKIRNNENLNRYIIGRLGDRGAVKAMEQRYGTTERYIENYKGDLVVKIFTDNFKKFNINNPTYKGLTTNLKADVKTVSQLDRGVAVLPNKKGEPTIYIDKATLDQDWKTQNYAQASSTTNLAIVPRIAFMNSFGVESKEDYQRFVIEREYQRYMWPFEKLAETEYFKHRYKIKSEKLKDVAKDLKPEEKERKILQNVYEEILRDKALNNTLNIWKLYKSKNTTADELFEIKAMHPQLATKFNIVRDLIISQGDEVRNNKTIASYKNITFRDNRVPVEDMNIYYNNMIELIQNPGIEDPVENKRVADFFSNLPLVGFLQSGLNTKDSLSIMRAMPTDKITDLMNEAKASYEKVMSNSIDAEKYLSDFTTVFNRHNNINNITIRRRFKDYSTTETVLKKPNYSLTKHNIPVEYTLPMNFGVSFDKAISGEMTATSRPTKEGIAPGDVIEFTKKYPKYTRSVLVRATSYENKLSDLGKDLAVQYDPSLESSFDELAKEGLYQFTFELISDEELADSTEQELMEVNPETRKQLESLIENNPNVIFVLEQKSKSELFDASYFEKYDNIAPIILDKTTKALEQSLDRIEDLKDSGATVATLANNIGYGKDLLKSLDDMWGPEDQEKFEKLSTRLYQIFQYENSKSKPIISNMVKETQKELDIIEYALDVPYEQLEAVRQKLKCS